MLIIQVVGYKNSGKTTTAGKIIEYFSQKGMRVASLKHHGHGGIPLGIKETDSEKHKKEGAVIAGVEGEGLLQLSSDTWDVEQMIAIYDFLKVEVLVIEGFKKYAFPKVVIVNREEDLVLLDQLNDIKVILTSVPLERIEVPYPIYYFSQIEALCECFTKSRFS
ncbi:molybdopterin-guanine dinucleotide biosynthesis protein B [Oceanobacillus halophilus]|uniref:Molybdopterin-guanine dinucleotide biosynthesis protein B n=1 Tax=Oceanobacillus halophilus TaxID=930130 RepID=A0A495AAW4_9BACI|nr:molybdopterin-guanine dinucleotide biosynthesis protein B [Oceanobacillus halophilus]RKQ37241.1 molybdopterin-guanine dinucleotide biosynthesis protein B [Oceanobacillus halophilus]